MMGITKRGASDNKLTTTVGTVGWMAPEVLRNPNDQNKKHKFTAERDYDGKKVCLAVATRSPTRAGLSPPLVRGCDTAVSLMLPMRPMAG